MTQDEVNTALGIAGFRTVSSHTTVVEFAGGACRPATALENRMYTLLYRLSDDATEGKIEL